MAETTRNHIFSKEISQVIIAAMVLAPNFYWKNCLRVISAMSGNPPLVLYVKDELNIFRLTVNILDIVQLSDVCLPDEDECRVMGNCVFRSFYTTYPYSKCNFVTG